ncbi:MAG TPA: lysylphosphatidylglycerol synthase domain-containing protein [Chitinophagaceae bacterium]|nr:lysylphosphatidylglycerol synthase domain-containing protein [Chitinophagaceae bacterium]
MKLNRNIKIFINYFLGPLLFIWLSWSIYREIINQPDLTIAWQKISESFSSPMLWNLVTVVLLMFINWSIEAIKWKISVNEIQKVSFSRALKAVLSGVSFSVSTPNRVGEYLGRVLYMEEGNRLKTISVTIAGSISQLIITLLMGLTGLIILRPAIEAEHFVSPIWLTMIIYGVLAVLLVLTLFYFRLSWLIKWIDRLPGMKRFAYLVRVLEDFNATLLLRILSLSLLRFFIFGIQYYLLFRFFDVDVSWWQAFWTVSVSFVVMAVIPTFAIAELGLRGKVSLIFTGLFSANKAGIIFTTAGIWFINLIIPAIVGSLMILSIKKIYTEKNEGI